jgi:TonB-dependent receptor
MAQDAAAGGQHQGHDHESDDEMTEILVTGIRKALQTSQEIKKEADTVIDSITARTSAPSRTSRCRSLQRMSGVTVTRFAASGDTTHFSAEPSGVVIRGLPQVRSEFNGRDSFNANSSRGLSFSDVSPELMAGVDTYKNATADMIEGGIAGTVNLRTHVPFDSEGFAGRVSAELGYGSSPKRPSPLGRCSQQSLGHGIGEFGVMLNAAYSGSDDAVARRTAAALLQCHRCRGLRRRHQVDPGGIDLREQHLRPHPQGRFVRHAVRSPDDSLLATLQYNYSEYENDWEEYSITAGVGNAQQPQRWC